MLINVDQIFSILLSISSQTSPLNKYSITLINIDLYWSIFPIDCSDLIIFCGKSIKDYLSVTVLMLLHFESNLFQCPRHGLWIYPARWEFPSHCVYNYSMSHKGTAHIIPSILIRDKDNSRVIINKDNNESILLAGNSRATVLIMTPCPIKGLLMS